MNKYKKWNIPLAVGAHYDGHMVHYAIPENPAYIALGDLPNPGSIEVIELAALEACQKRLDEALIYLKRARNTMSCYDDCDSLFSEEERCNCGTENDMHEIDAFLSHKDEGE